MIRFPDPDPLVPSDVDVAYAEGFADGWDACLEAHAGRVTTAASGRCIECDQWRKFYNAARASGYINAAREYDHRIAAHERTHGITTATPKRIQRRRTKGWRVPEGAIYVGRPTRWGNLWHWETPDIIDARTGLPNSRASAVSRFRDHAARTLAYDPSWLDPLRGHDLACWCPLDQPCHADVLLELANA